MPKLLIIVATAVAATLTIVGIVTNLLITTGGVPESVRLVFFLAGAAWLCTCVLYAGRAIVQSLQEIRREQRHIGVNLDAIVTNAKQRNAREALEVLRTAGDTVSHGTVTPLRPAR